MTATTAASPIAARWRRVTLVVLAVAAAAFSTLLIPGAEALLGGWSLTGAHVIHRVHEVGFGLLMTVCIAAPFLAQAVAPARATSLAWAATASSAVTIVVLAASGLAADSAPFVILLLVAVIVLALRPMRTVNRPIPVDRRILTFAATTAIPLLVDAWAQIGLQRAATADDPHAVPPHYARMAALALCIAALSVIAAWCVPGHRATAVLAAVAAATWAVASLVNLGFVGALSAPAAVAAIVAAVLYVGLIWRPGRRMRSRPSDTQHPLVTPTSEGDEQ